MGTVRMIRAALAAALVAAALTACGGGGGAVGAWRDLAGVRDATIHKVALDTDYYGYYAVIDMDADATRDQIAGALDALAEWRRGRGGDDTVNLYVGAGTVARDDGGGWGDGAWHGGPQAVITVARGHARNVGYADLLLRARRVLGTPVFVRGWEWMVTTDHPLAVARQVLADPVLAATPGVDIAPADEMGEEPRPLPASISSSEVLTARHLATYRKAVANERLVREGRAHVTFVGSPTNEIPPQTRRNPGLISIYMDLRLPGSGGPKTLAADPTRDPRWPVVAAQLDLLRGLPKGSMVWISLFWGPIDEGSGPRNYTSLVEVVNGHSIVHKPRWNAAAAAYLRG